MRFLVLSGIYSLNSKHLAQQHSTNTLQFTKETFHLADCHRNYGFRILMISDVQLKKFKKLNQNPQI